MNFRLDVKSGTQVKHFKPNMTLQSAFVNKLRRVREKLGNSNCCFDICRDSFKSASNHMAQGGRVRGDGEGGSSALHSGNPSISSGHTTTMKIIAALIQPQQRTETVMWCFILFPRSHSVIQSMQ